MSEVRTVNSGLRCRHDHFTICIAASCHDILVTMRYPILESVLISVSVFIHHLLLEYHTSPSFHPPPKIVRISQARLELAWVITILLKSSNAACYTLYRCWLILLASRIDEPTRSLNERPIFQLPSHPIPQNPPSIPHTAAAAYSTHQT